MNGVKAQVKADDIVGVWLTGGKEPAKIQIYKSGPKYYGKIAWLKNPKCFSKKTWFSSSRKVKS